MGRCFLGAILAIAWPAIAQEGTLVEHLEVVPQQDESIRVSWDAPPAAEGVAVYTIHFSDDLEEWVEVEGPDISFENGRAIWIDDQSLTGAITDAKRFYRVWEQLPIDLSRITRRLGEEGEIPLAVRYTPELEPFEPSEEALQRSRERFDLTVQQELDHVLGEYLVLFADDVFPYAIDRGEGAEAMLVTEDGVPLQQFASELIETGGGELLAAWEGSVEGFAAYLPPPLVEELQASALVKLVEGNGIGERQFEDLHNPPAE